MGLPECTSGVMAYAGALSTRSTMVTEPHAEVGSFCDARSEADGALGVGRKARSMRYLAGDAVRALTTFGGSSEFRQSPKTRQGPDSGWQG